MYFICIVLGFELRALYLLGRHLSHALNSSFFRYFSNRVSHFARPGLDQDPPIYTSCIAQMTGMLHCALLFIG
jgi:hypothetical protein